MKEIQRTFIVGDEWLYYKIYTGPKTSELILMDDIKPVSEKLMDQRLIDKWFFVRYNDPEYHLRIRFHCIEPNSFVNVIHELRLVLKKYLDKDLIWKVQLDTYVRELERYGPNNIESFEKLFFYDSKMILQYLHGVNEVDKEQNRWLFGVLVIDGILNHFGYELFAKLKIMEELKFTFGIEFGLNKRLKRTLDSKFRANKSNIDSYLGNSNEKTNEQLSFLRTMVDTYQIECNTSFNSIINKTEPEDLDSIVKSYLHMFANRLFRSKNRLQEFVIYYFLHKNYKAEHYKFEHQNK